MLVDTTTINGITTRRLEFKVPLHRSSDDLISVCVNVIQSSESSHTLSFSKPILYLEGGPGFASGLPTDNSGVTKELLGRGYQVFSLDQRGTGYSTPLEASGVTSLEHLKAFRSDYVIEDCEHIRKTLGIEKWTLLGQSNGGFLSFIYLSKYPASLEQVLVTGGIPPIGFGNDHVYKATYARTTERNRHYYAKYPQDVEDVLSICRYLNSTKTVLPCGGTLSVERFQQLGLSFGARGGTDTIHRVVNKFAYELQRFSKPSAATLAQIASMQSFGTNVIYTFFLEAIYCEKNSEPSAWTAHRLRHAPGNENYVYTDSSPVVYFTGEMVYPSMFEDYVELRGLKEIANEVHEHSEWSDLYDEKVLGSIGWNDVPIVAAVYIPDQYVDFETSLAVKRRVFGDGNLRVWVTNELFHNGLRSAPERVLGALFGLLGDEID